MPRPAARRAGAPSHPAVAERYLAAQLERMAAHFARAVRAILTRDVLDDLARWPAGFRADAADNPEKDSRSAAKLLASRMRAAADASFSKAAVRSVSQQAARRVEAHSRDQFRRIGVDVKREPVLKVLVSGWARDQAERVKGLADDQVAKLADILGGAGARHAETIARDIEEQLGVTASRAEFVARDSIGSINSRITRERLRAAKVTLYIWTTMRDSRVREEHAALDGEVFDVDGDGDPEEGHAGDPPGCRCIQYPLPSDESESEDKDEEAA